MMKEAMLPNGVSAGSWWVRVLKDGGAIHHVQIRCEEDELARMRALYTQSG